MVTSFLPRVVRTATGAQCDSKTMRTPAQESGGALNVDRVDIGDGERAALKDFRTGQIATGTNAPSPWRSGESGELFQFAEASFTGNGSVPCGDDPGRRSDGAKGAATGSEGKRTAGLEPNRSCGAPYPKDGAETPVADVRILSARNDAGDAFAAKLPVGREYQPSRDRGESSPSISERAK